MTVNGVPLKVDLMREPWVVEKVVWPVAKTWKFGGGVPKTRVQRVWNPG